MMYYPDVPALEPDELELLCHEYLEHNATLDPHLADQMGVKRGLRNLDGTGVLAGITNVSNVIGYDKKEDGTIVPIPGRLVYRGIDIDTLAAEADAHDRFMFEEVIWLLLFGSLPTQEQYAKFRKLLEHHRELPQGFADDMILNSPSPNLMNKMARSVLAMYSYDEHAEDNSLPNILRQSINLIAELPTMMVNAYQIKRRVYDRSSMYFHLPTEGQSTAEHILSTYRADQKFTHEEARLLDLCLLVHADHGGGNCSTFTCRVLSSSGTDTYAAISSAISLMEVVGAFAIDNAAKKGKQVDRTKVTLIVSGLILIEALLVAVDGLGSTGIFRWKASAMWNDCMLDFMDCWSEGVAMPVGAMLMSLMISLELGT